MPSLESVRFSRDGDEFHYLWAARRCLRLLLPSSGLVAVAIEGASPGEQIKGPPTGDEVIDVAEYFGSERVQDAALVRYVQLKHSTLHDARPRTLSGLAKTLAGFGQRFRAVRSVAASASTRIEFLLVSNRPVDNRVIAALAAIGASGATQDKKLKTALQKITGLNDEHLAEYCSLVRFDDRQEGYWGQRNRLAEDVSGFLPDADADGPVQLKELVRRKALSENAASPTITKIDVLRALKTNEQELFPAPNLIAPSEHLVPRQQHRDLIKLITESRGAVIVHAEAGVGKSAFCSVIKSLLPSGSACVVYDCFGNGQYRNRSTYRHRHRDGLVQIANELAAQGLCYPLIPSPHADATSYTRAFIHRLKQAITAVHAQNPDSFLCIAVDAADNAEMAAEEAGDVSSFARELIRESLPDGVHLFVLCRSHRRGLLAPPPIMLEAELQPFSRGETAQHLKSHFPAATDEDVDEFHRLSSRNPRVQATALAKKVGLHEILRNLGPNPKSVEDTLDALLHAAISDLCDKAGAAEKRQIERVLAALSVLRPLVPVSVLAGMSGVSEAAIRSFALELGRPLFVRDTTIEFFDEPAETWFRERFKPSQCELKAFADSLVPFAGESAYVAGAIPQIMLEAGQIDELVALALSNDALPTGNPVARRDVELQRLQFALKASIRAGRWKESAKLALKAGGEAAGDERQQTLIQNNTDLAAVLLSTDRVQELVAQRNFGSGWMGSHHAYEAGLLAGKRDLVPDARSRLRMAQEWLTSLLRLPTQERERGKLTACDIAEMAYAHLKVGGSERCARFIRRWRPVSVRFQIGEIVGQRLADGAQNELLDSLAIAARNDLGLILGLVSEARKVHRALPKEVVARACRLIGSRRVNVSDYLSGGLKDDPASALVANLAEAACVLGVSQQPVLGALIKRYLPNDPPVGLSSVYGNDRVPYLRTYALAASLQKQTLQLYDVAAPALRKEIAEKRSSGESLELRDFKEVVGSTLPWHRLVAEVTVGHVTSCTFEAAVDEARKETSEIARYSYRESWHRSDEIARLWLSAIVQLGSDEQLRVAALVQWLSSSKKVSPGTLCELARVCAHCSELRGQALSFAAQARQAYELSREDAESEADFYIQLARAVMPVSVPEAGAYFDLAIQSASKIGNENLDRWAATLDLADRAARPDHPLPELAYRFARCAEVTYDYVARDKHFDWGATIRAMVGLCPASSVAIVSRWHDRHFGSVQRTLPLLFTSLSRRGLVSPQVTLAMFCFGAEWNIADIFAQSIGKFSSQQARQTAVDLFCRYVSLYRQDAELWSNLTEVARLYDVRLPDFGRFVRTEAEGDNLPKSRERTPPAGELSTKRASTDWSSIFQDADLRTPAGVLCAYERHRATEPPFYQEDFLAQAFRRVPAGEEADFIKAFGQVPSFSVYNIRSVLECLPKAWRDYLGVKRAISDLVRRTCAQHWLDITKSRYYQPFPLKLATERSGLSESELVEIVLKQAGAGSEVLGPSRLFTLVGLLAGKLTPEEAQDALSFALDLFDPVLRQTDGDGPWIPALSPRPNVSSAIAGLIWAFLAAPKAATRWEAAHCVRFLCAVGSTEVLVELARQVRAGVGGPFADAALPFYGFHGIQWLMIALARATKESPNSVVVFLDLLKQFSDRSYTHVLIRGFAADALAALAASKVIDLSAEECEALRKINVSRLPVITSDLYKRRSTPGRPDRPYEQKRFHFAYDMDKYLFAPLADCFALSEDEVEEAAEAVIYDDWGLQENGRWDNDERASRGYFRDRSSRYSSTPKEDNLCFYRSYHALMEVAGKLLDTRPTHKDPSTDWRTFEYWLSEQQLTRRDGNWLSDRRDPPPSEIVGNATCGEDEWPWSLTRESFPQHLFPVADRVCVWGSWSVAQGSRQEHVCVRTALVSPQRAFALLAALQTADDLGDSWLPEKDGNWEIEEEPFVLKGWILDHSGDRGLDDSDPWSAQIRFPPLQPSFDSSALACLSVDSELRAWKRAVADSTEAVVWSEVWGEPHDNDEDEYTDERGRRLLMSRALVSDVMEMTGMDLIALVEIRRDLRRSKYRSRGDDDYEYIKDSKRFFVLRGKHRVLTV